jgi:glutathione S-transferase
MDGWMTGLMDESWKDIHGTNQSINRSITHSIIAAFIPYGLYALRLRHIAPSPHQRNQPPQTHPHPNQPTNQQVPILWLPSGRVITESDAILDHLAALPGRKAGQPNPLTPPSEVAFKKWRALLSPFLKSARTALERGDSPGLSSLLYKLNKDMPTPGPFLAGDAFSVADASVLPFAQRLVEDHGDVLREAAPKLHAWYEACADRPSFKATRVSGWWWWW